MSLLSGYLDEHHYQNKKKLLELEIELLKLKNKYIDNIEKTTTESHMNYSAFGDDHLYLTKEDLSRIMHGEPIKIDALIIKII